MSLHVTFLPSIVVVCPHTPNEAGSDTESPYLEGGRLILPDLNPSAGGLGLGFFSTSWGRGNSNTLAGGSPSSAGAFG